MLINHKSDTKKTEKKERSIGPEVQHLLSGDKSKALIALIASPGWCGRWWSRFFHPAQIIHVLPIIIFLETQEFFLDNTQKIWDGQENCGRQPPQGVSSYELFFGAQARAQLKTWFIFEPEPSLARKSHFNRARAELSSDIPLAFEPVPSLDWILNLSLSWG